MTNSSQGPQANYVTLLEMDPESLKILADRSLSLMPGMAVSITIATKPRSPFDAVFVTFRESFKKATQSH